MDLKIDDNDTIISATLSYMDGIHRDLLVVDVGARNGFQLLSDSYTQNAHIVGFEPNKDEYDKLISRTTDAQRAGERLSNFKTEKYHPYAIWDEPCERLFYLTQGLGASTLLGESDERKTANMFLSTNSDDTKTSFYDQHTKIRSTNLVRCETLDRLLGNEEKIDFLKLDVEGAEMQCLRGAENLFTQKKVLFLYTEFAAFSFYKEGHSTLGGIHKFMSERGYRLLAFNLSHNEYRRGGDHLPDHADRKLVYAGDLIFSLDPDAVNLSPGERLRIALICFNFGFNSMGLSLLRESGLVPSKIVESIRNALSNQSSLMLLLHWWNKFPQFLFRKVFRILG